MRQKTRWTLESFLTPRSLELLKAKKILAKLFMKASNWLKKLKLTLGYLPSAINKHYHTSMKVDQEQYEPFLPTLLKKGTFCKKDPLFFVETFQCGFIAFVGAKLKCNYSQFT